MECGWRLNFWRKRLKCSPPAVRLDSASSGSSERDWSHQGLLGIFQGGFKSGKNAQGAVGLLCAGLRVPEIFPRRVPYNPMTLWI